MRRFCIVFEGKYSIHLGNYKFLRHALSHLELDEKTVKSLKTHFRLECSLNKETGKVSFDTTSPPIRHELKKHAEILKKEAMSLLNSNIS